MELTDTRPPFAGLNGQSPQALFGALPTPCYILDEARLRENGLLLARVAREAGCRILLAQKAFSNFDLYGVLAPFLAGTEASGLYEARLGREEMPGGEVHVFCAAYKAAEFDGVLRYADHIVFNSPRQLAKFGPAAKAAGKSVGLRINPERSTQQGHGLYDPCAPGSRLGVTRAQWNAQMTPSLFALLDGLHFHTLCEQDADALEITLGAVEERFGDLLPAMRWLNMGGGHHVTRPGYDTARLIRCVRRAAEQWGVEVYLEPGEACALNAGYLVARVEDLVENNGVKTAVLDASFACHMPDTLEMPYTPPLYGAAEAAEGENTAFTYRLGGPTCLSGDVLPAYTSGHALREGELLLFGDMAIYTTCKNNTFNGMPLPDIWRYGADGRLTRLTAFGYGDFKRRLGVFPG